jgi:hypothetical protein
MTGHGTKFGRKKEDAIAALLSNRNVEEAARAAGVGYKTLLRWLEIPEFKEAYRKARREAVQQAVARLQQGSGIASLAMLKTLADPNTPGAVRLRAAAYVLDYSLQGVELEDVLARLDRLERSADENKPDWRK